MDNQVVIKDEYLFLLKNCKNINDTLKKRLAIASIISAIFNDNNLNPPIVVGGLALAVYSYGQYGTLDIDMVSNTDHVPYEIIKKIGYKKVEKEYYNKDLDSYIEFPSQTLNGSIDKIAEYLVEDTNLPVFIIGIEDLILDRIGSYVATNDKNSEEWALRLIGGMYSYIDWSYLHRDAHRRGILPIVEKLQRKVKRYKNLYRLMNMQDNI